MVDCPLGHDLRRAELVAPVDDEHSILYLRQYQNFMRVPVLRSIVNRLSVPTNLFIAHQDRRVVVTQLPKRTTLKMGEKLIQGDGPRLLVVDEFYKARPEFELLQAAKQPA